MKPLGLKAIPPAHAPYLTGARRRLASTAKHAAPTPFEAVVPVSWAPTSAARSGNISSMLPAALAPSLWRCARVAGPTKDGGRKKGPKRGGRSGGADV